MIQFDDYDEEQTMFENTPQQEISPELQHAYTELIRYVDSELSCRRQAERTVYHFHLQKKSILDYDLLEMIDPQTMNMKLQWVRRIPPAR